MRELCSECNAHLGAQVDSALANDSAILLVRQAFEIRGKKGRIPNPLRNGHIVGFPGPRVSMFRDKAGTMRHNFEPTMIEELFPDGHGTLQYFNDDMSDSERRGVLLKRAARLGRVGQFTRSPWARQGRIERPMFQFEKQIQAAAVERALVKIAYELTYRRIGPSYLKDPVAARIREYLRLTAASLGTQRAADFGIQNSGLALYLNRTDAILRGYGVDVLNLGALRAGKGYLVITVYVLGVYGTTCITASSDYGLDPRKAHIVQDDLRTGIFFESTVPNPQPIA